MLTAEIPRVMAALWQQRHQQQRTAPTLAERFQCEMYRQATPPTNFGFGGGYEDFKRRGRVERYRRMFAGEFELRRVVERYQRTRISEACLSGRRWLP